MSIVIDIEKKQQICPKEPRDQKLKALGTMDCMGMKTEDLIKSL